MTILQQLMRRAYCNPGAVPSLASFNHFSCTFCRLAIRRALKEPVSQQSVTYSRAYRGPTDHAAPDYINDWRRTFADAAELPSNDDHPTKKVPVDAASPQRKPKRTSKLQARLVEEPEHEITAADIPLYTLRVMQILRSAGHEGYIVGGAVRDLILGIKPKDFDILTSASPQQVKKMFPYALLIGRRHPIVKFTQGSLEMEISSFDTGSQGGLPDDAAALLAKSRGNHYSKGSKKSFKRKAGHHNFEASEQGLEDTLIDSSLLSWSAAREKNALDRDFTVNSLMYDPFSRIVFDYTNGIQDCRQRRLSFILDPKTSLTIDPARGLRAVRLAARVGLEPDSQSSRAIRECRDLLLGLSPARLQMELDTIMCCGAASKSIKLLWTLNLLEYIFPPLHQILQSLKYPKSKARVSRQKDSLFRVLDGMDVVADPLNPLPAFVWPAVLIGYAAHLGNTPEVSKKALKAEASKEGSGKHKQSGNSSKQNSLEQPEAGVFKAKGKWKSTLDEFLKAPMSPIPKGHTGFILRMLDAASGKQSPGQGFEYRCRSCGNEMRIAPDSDIFRCPCGRPLPEKLRTDHSKAGKHIVKNALQECS